MNTYPFRKLISNTLAARFITINLNIKPNLITKDFDLNDSSNVPIRAKLDIKLTRRYFRITPKKCNQQKIPTPYPQMSNGTPYITDHRKQSFLSVRQRNVSEFIQNSGEISNKNCRQTLPYEFKHKKLACVYSVQPRTKVMSCCI